MKTTFTYVLIACAMITSAWAQDRAESLKLLVKNSQDPVERLQALDSLGMIYKDQDVDAYTYYTLEYIELAKQLDSIEAAARRVIRISNIFTKQKNQPETTLKLTNSFIARKYQIKDSFLLGSLYLKRGGAQFDFDLNEAVSDYKLAIENYGVQDSLYVADAYLFLGQAYSNLGKFVPAAESFHRAYAYFENLKDYEYMLHAQQGIVVMFSMNGFYEKAISERNLSIEKYKNLDLTKHLTTSYYNQALDYKKLGDHRKNLEYLLKSYETMQNLPERDVTPNIKIMLYSALLEYYSDIGDLEEAQKFLITIEEIYSASGKSPQNKSYYYGAKAHHAMATGRIRSAVAYAEKKLENVLQVEYEDDILQSYKLLHETHEANKNYQESLRYLTKYDSLRVSMYNKTTANALAYYQTLYETERTTRELMAKNTRIQLLAKDNSNFKKLVTFVSIVMILAFGVLLLFRNQRHLKNTKSLQERFSQALLISQENERKRISKDLHDGLGQQLLLIKNKLFTQGDKETKAMVDATIEEVRAISRDLHPFQLQEMGITKALEFTLKQVDENTSLFVSSEIDNIDNLFNPEQEVNIYRIVQESLSNIIKHAKAEAGKVSVERFKNNVRIVIKDNGVGFDFNEKYKNIRSLGLKTLLERTKFLNGQMKIYSKHGTGTEIEFKIPTV
ncbi:tetratricopeptide repeat-containing sensor histidine kinase [Altibacter sp. HG106]|uniref:tetratricopeptide repeat-containing sensor histidine kinase n=1 Tax=Altibacter sp. HG106 TaxID=3023937 RepID=UPI0023507529|nr:ATP-binding protein [Altibacter sp. HG106]MDC7994750.1 histidine kinase [Altibacter sp. HG106]